MRSNDYPVEALQERGVRVTPQRAHIWRALVESGDHFTAEGLWERVRGQLPGLELSTVYRSLEAMRAAGLVSESRPTGGPRFFEARPASHPHLVCDGCGRILHPDPETGRRMLAELDAGSFEVRELHVIARGTCGACATGRAPNDERQEDEWEL